MIFYHAGFDFFSGGYLGVDVFFVISGFLITMIIYPEVQSGTFSIVNFYERRIRRLMPALSVVILATLILGWFWVLPHDYDRIAESALTVVFFGSNIYFWQSGGYFESANELKPLLHTWSLAVEEQFYIIFPLLLIALRRIPGGVLCAIIMVAIALSLGTSEFASTWKPEAAFFLLPTRAWELGIGSLLAVALVSRKIAPGLEIARVPAEILSLAGLGLVLSAMLLFEHDTRHPSVLTAFPVVGTALLLWLATPKTYVGRLLSLKPFVGIGLISYSLYLWHQPVMSFSRIRFAESGTLSWSIGMIVFSLVLGWASWRFVERPFRNKRVVGRRSLFSAAAAASVVLILAAGGIVSMNGAPGRVPPDLAARISNPGMDHGSKIGACVVHPHDDLRPDRHFCLHGPTDPKVIFWGDSHALALTGEMMRALNDHGYGMIQATNLACVPAVGYRWSDAFYDCDTKNRQIIDFVNAQPLSVPLIVHGRWSFFLNGAPVNSTGLCYQPPSKRRPVLNDTQGVTTGDPDDHILAAIAPILATGREVVVMSSIPEPGCDLRSYLSLNGMLGRENPATITMQRDVIDARIAPVTGLFQKAATRYDNLEVIDLAPALCGETCNAYVDETLFFSDRHHLSEAGARMTVDYAFPRILGILERAR